MTNQGVWNFMARSAFPPRKTIPGNWRLLRERQSANKEWTFQGDGRKGRQQKEPKICAVIRFYNLLTKECLKKFKRGRTH